MRGTCGTCGADATATAENEGYSSCCNDRIEYDLEAEQTRRRVACDHSVMKTVTVSSCGFDMVWSKHEQVVCANCEEVIQ